MFEEDPEVILKVGASIVDKIYVERLPGPNRKTKKIKLHFKLNILGYFDYNLNFEDFLLLFHNRDRCRSSPW